MIALDPVDQDRRYTKSSSIDWMRQSSSPSLPGIHTSYVCHLHSMIRFVQEGQVSLPKKKQYSIARRKYQVLFETPHDSMTMLRIRKGVAKKLLMMRSNTPYIPITVDPLKWKDRGAPNACWLNHRLDGDGSFQVDAYLGTEMGTWGMNFGTASLLIRGLLTKEQKNGILLRQYDLSHLCGNWRCMNYRHHFVEPKVDNLQRKSCFANVDKPCPHTPPCLIWNQEHDGSHLSPNAKRFRKYAVCLDPLIEPEGQIGSMEIDVVTNATDISTEELTKGTGPPKDSAWELDMLSVRRPVISNTHMESDHWSEADRFFNRARYEQGLKYLE